MSAIAFISKIFGFGIIGGLIGLLIGFLLNNSASSSASAQNKETDEKKAFEAKMRFLSSFVSIGSNVGFSLGFLYLVGWKISLYFGAPLLVVVAYLTYQKFFGSQSKKTNDKTN